MRRIFTNIFICLLVSEISYPAVKVNISFDNGRFVSGLITYDIRAQIFSGQTWRVGSSNIRVDWTSIPPNSISVHPDNPAYNPNPNINSNMYYSTMTTTSINGGVAISLNIVWNTTGPCYTFNPGTYTLGSIRFNVIDTGGCFRMTIRTSSVLQDSITQLFYPADWTTTIDTICHLIYGPDGTNNIGDEIPKVFRLYDCYPNPFNPSAKIRYDIPKPCFVKISVYDITGKEIRKITDGYSKPGKYEAEFDGSNYASGVYFYKLETEYFMDSKKMILVK